MSSYRDYGVDTAAGDRAVELMKQAVASTHGHAVVNAAGGFAGLLDVSELLHYRRPLLATSTDGVGTKVAIAQALDIHDTIGQDLVAMVVDDLVVCGAKPLAMTDYIATGNVVPETIAAIVSGIAAACRATGTALVGGETAEHPGLLEPGEYDVAGAAVGVVEAEDLLGPERVRDGDVVLGLAASGLHSNGYSLVRRVFADAGWRLERQVAELGRTLGEELLEPTRLYTDICLAMMRLSEGVHAFSHVTGGGLAANLARVLPTGLTAVVRRDAWQVPPIFPLIGRVGAIASDDLEDALNMGVGMLAVVSADACDQLTAILADTTVTAWPIGEVRPSDDAAWAQPDSTQRVVQGTKGIAGGRVVMVGSYDLG